MNWSGIGHEKQKKHFEKLIADGQLAHAYLFAGTEMVGKRQIAEDIARVLVPHGYELDIMRLAPERDPETGKTHDISIDETKKLKSWISLRPTSGHKVVIIDDAERLGGEAANNLLKIIEEPPAYVHFFLISGKPGQMMQTIVSRCELVQFRGISEEEMKEVLAGQKLDADDRMLLAAVATGKPGLAMRFIQEDKLPVVAKSIAELGRILKSGIAEKIAFAKKLADDEAASDIVSWWLSYTHAKLGEKPYLAPIVQGLLELCSVLDEPQYNRRLAIEHFFLTNSIQR